MKNQTENNKIRYEMRNEIENIIKQKHIDRTIFHEVAKSNYEKVLRKIYYSFCDYQKYPTIEVSSYMWVRFRDGLKQTDLFYVDWADWNNYIDYIDQLIPEEESSVFYYLLVDGGWVYEGTLTGIKQVLYDFPVWMEDFYITPKNYAWLIVHCEDGECMFKVWN